MPPSVLRWCCAALVVGASCTGQISSSTVPSGAAGRTAATTPSIPTPGVNPAPEVSPAPSVNPAPGGSPTTLAPASRSGLRRLSRAELDATLYDLLLDESGPAARRLPEENLDVRFAFDNDHEANRDSSLAYVEAVESLVTDAVRAALADAKRRAKFLPCAPKDAADSTCFHRIVESFGRRALRRPLDAEEMSRYDGLLALGKDAGDVTAAVETLLRALLTSPEFIYRFEVGTPVAAGSDVYRLSGYELATRLSYTLLGTTPSDVLLDAAAQGRLDSAEGVRTAALSLLKDPRARTRVHQFYALWLGYARGLPPGLGAAMLDESKALIDDVVFDTPRDHREIFLSKRTFIGETLRKHYTDIGAPIGPAAWVDYGKSGRRGILSHGSVLSAFRTGDDTSITKRGLFVRLRLLCEEVPEPPPDVSVDVTAAATECKTGSNGFYTVSHQGASCKGCHDRLDPIGFGLERFDSQGLLRSHDAGKPQCTLDGKGSVSIDSTTQTFEGPGGLAEVVANSGRLDKCVLQHLYRFALGRHERPDDDALLAELTAAFAANGRQVGRALVDLVAHPSFALRRAIP